MFGAAACFACHRFGNEGGMTGPDLTAAGGRYSARDFLDQVLNPSKEINEQFVPTVLTRNDGTTVTGAVVNLNGDTVTTLAPRTPNDAVKKAAGPTDSVTQEIAWVVKGGKADCVINGTSVWSSPVADLVGPGKLESTDGVWGIRVSHNMDLTVTGLSAGKS